MMNAKDNLINDGLSVNQSNRSLCTNNGGQYWTYNQGVILGAASMLYKATHDVHYTGYASKLANAVLVSSLTDARGILTESCGDTCNEDGKQFKGIFCAQFEIPNRHICYLSRGQHSILQVSSH